MTAPEYAIMEGVDLGENVNIHDQVNIYHCEIGAETKIDAFVYIEEGVKIGNRCTVRPFTFIPRGVCIKDEVFIGPSVTFTNDRRPSVDGEWDRLDTVVQDRVSIGAGATIGSGIEIGSGALIGAGAVVLEDVPPDTTVVGNPAEILNE